MRRITQDICERDSHYCFEIIEGNEYKTTGEYTREEAIDKLGKLEDIEDEIGIDLITLFNALKNGIYVKWYYRIAKLEPDEIGISLRENCFIVQELYFEETGNKWYFKDYGKTWALTKEELENDK